MLPEQRRKHILHLLAERNFIELTRLAAELEISMPTARRDLNALEQEGIIKRTHGGAMFLGDRNALPIFDDRQAIMAPQKAAIGRRAAELVQDGDTIIIDGGTTPYQLALNLRHKKNIQIVTNSLPVANAFADANHVQLISTGGTLYPGTGVYLGPYAENMLKTIKAQKAFIGMAGITEAGFYNSNALVVQTERCILDAAGEIYVVADHSKFDRNALAFLCDFPAVTAVITDTHPRDFYQKKTRILT